MRHLYRSATLLLLAVVLAAPVLAQKTKTIKETFSLDADGEVIVDTYKGSITVTTWDRPEVGVDIRIEADEDAHLVADTKVRIDASEMRLVLETDYEEAKRKNSRWGFGTVSLPFVHYTLKVPATASVHIDDYKSDIYVEALRADLDVETYKGTVEILKLDGALRLETYKGEVLADFVRFGGDSRFDTYKGTIAVRLPRGAGFDLDADIGRRGDLDADFSLASVHRGEETYRGAINGGGPRLSLDTYKGRYRLRSR